MRKNARGLLFLLLVLAVLFSLGALWSEGNLRAEDGNADKSTLQDKAMTESMQKEEAVSVSSEEAAKAKKLSLAPDFTLQDTYQDIITLSKYRGKYPVVLFFWTTWCPFCQKELLVLNDMYADLIDSGLEVLGIDVGETPDKVITFVKGKNLSYRVLMDKDSSVSNSYGILGVPTYVLVDLEGKVVFQDNYFPRSQYKDLLGVK